MTILIALTSGIVLCLGLLGILIVISGVNGRDE